MSVLHILAEDEHQQRIFAIMTLSCEFTEDMSDATARVMAANAEMYGKLQNIIRLAARQNMLASGWTVDTAARAFQCSVNGLFGEWLRSGKSFSLVEVGEKLVTTLIGSMRAPRSAN
jgi:hypothetical protein